MNSPSPLTDTHPLTISFSPPGSADFYAIDSYRSSYVRAPEGGIDACVNNPSDPNWPQCNEAVLYDGDEGWLEGPAADPRTDWLASTPQGVRGLLNELHKRWPSPKLVGNIALQ